ncbi:unnamed protein product [Lasius platythorax]|uniref:Uncharacterized protein n=1 Tax=Lasius platythorax TaxID=488582 RepID=A0AAV2NT21_9HYME
MKFGGFEKCATGDRSSQFSVKEQVKMSESEVLAASYGRFLFFRVERQRGRAWVGEFCYYLRRFRTNFNGEKEQVEDEE